MGLFLAIAGKSLAGFCVFRRGWTWATVVVARHTAGRGGIALVPVQISERLRVVADNSVQIQRLRVAEVRIRHRRGNGRPVRAHEPPDLRRVVSRSKIIQVRFPVPLLAGKILRTWIATPRSAQTITERHALD